MEHRRWLNTTAPVPLVWAQFLLYAWALDSFARTLTHLRTVGVPALVLGLVPALLLIGYLIANESAWGYRLAVVACPLSLWPLMDELARTPSAVLHADFLALVALPFVVFTLLLTPEARDHHRLWFR